MGENAQGVGDIPRSPFARAVAAAVLRTALRESYQEEWLTTYAER